MRESIDLIGKRFGEWTVIKKTQNKAPSGNFKWLCRCSCGREFEVDGNSLKGGYSTRCVHCVGKLKLNKYSSDPIKIVFMGMKQRCQYKRHIKYEDYGGRGIKICDEWLNHPEKFYEWAYLNGYKKGLTIDRIDNNQGYSPENCRFIPHSEQMKNRRNVYRITIDGETDTLTAWCKRKGLVYSTVRARIAKGVPIMTALRH